MSWFWWTISFTLLFGRAASIWTPYEGVCHGVCQYFCGSPFFYPGPQCYWPYRCCVDGFNRLEDLCSFHGGVCLSHCPLQYTAASYGCPLGFLCCKPRPAQVSIPMAMFSPGLGAVCSTSPLGHCALGCSYHNALVNPCGMSYICCRDESSYIEQKDDDDDEDESAEDSEEGGDDEEEYGSSDYDSDYDSEEEDEDDDYEDGDSYEDNTKLPVAGEECNAMKNGYCRKECKEKVTGACVSPFICCKVDLEIDISLDSDVEYDELPGLSEACGTDSSRQGYCKRDCGPEYPVDSACRWGYKCCSGQPPVVIPGPGEKCSDLQSSTGYCKAECNEGIVLPRKCKWNFKCCVQLSAVFLGPGSICKDEPRAFCKSVCRPEDALPSNCANRYTCCKVASVGLPGFGEVCNKLNGKATCSWNCDKGKYVGGRCKAGLACCLRNFSLRIETGDGSADVGDIANISNKFKES